MIPLDDDFHGVFERRVFLDIDLGAFQQPHLQQPSSQGPGPSHPVDDPLLALPHVAHGHGQSGARCGFGRILRIGNALHLNFFGDSLAQHVPFCVHGHDDLALVEVGDHLDSVAHPQSHAHHADAGTGPAGQAFHRQPFPGLGRGQGHVHDGAVQAVGADPVDLHAVLQHVKPVGRSQKNLAVFHLVVLKLDDAAALCADHVVVVLAQVAVLVAGQTVVELVFPGEAELAHQFEGVPHEFGVISVSKGGQQLLQLLGGDVLFGVEKRVQDLEPVFKTVDVFLLEQGDELLFFLVVNRFHGAT